MEIQETIERVAKNPASLGWFAIGVGLLFLAAAVFNWQWFFGGSSHNTDKIEGVSNVRGRGAARIKAGSGGIGLIVVGVILLLLL